MGIEGIFGSAEEDALFRAEDLVDDAWEAGTAKRRVALAMKALEISPLCADAYVLLAEHAEPGSDDQLDLWRRGVAAGEAALGESTFDEEVGYFWGLVETRPYMRARLGLAMAMWARGTRNEAVDHLRDMLRLNPGDNQGIRYVLASFLLELDRDEELGALLKSYDEEASAEWTFTTALAAFRRAGDGPESRKLLGHALKSNPHVPAYLLGEERMPKALPAFMTVGGKDEAICYVGQFSGGWRRTPGALDWLRERCGAPKVKKPRGRSPSR